MSIDDDPVIDRIRKIRRIISEEHDNDPKKLVEHYINLEKNMNLTFFDPREDVAEKTVRDSEE